VVLQVAAAAETEREMMRLTIRSVFFTNTFIWYGGYENKRQRKNRKAKKRDGFDTIENNMRAVGVCV